jgi:DNA topoisomerase I
MAGNNGCSMPVPGRTGEMEPLEGPEAAKAAGLRYTTDALTGIRRVKRGRSFSYLTPDGKPVIDRGELARIKALAFPPAYTRVWISPIPNGHLQATGYDARGRKQYRYHKRWRAVRDETKFHRMLAFAKALPTIRAKVARDMGASGLPREKVLATVVSLLEATAIRVGNEEYAREDDSYGLTTLREEHAKVKGATIRFHFKGKSGKLHDVEVHDKRLARIVKASQDLPGQHLFEYRDDAGQPHPIHSEDVNVYLHQISGDHFTAKDFRTWEATMICALELAAVKVSGATAAKRAVVEAIKRVAAKLGNTPAVCKKSYIHPGVIDEFLANGALELVEKKLRATDPYALSVHEGAVVALIERIVERENQPLGDLLAKSVSAANAKRVRRKGGTAA